MTAGAYSFRCRDIRIRANADSLVIENRVLRREFRLIDGFPATQRLLYKPSGFELAAERAEGDVSIAGYNMPWHAERRTAFSLRRIHARVRRTNVLYPERVVLSLWLHDTVQQLDVLRETILYFDQPFVSSRFRIRCPVHPKLYWSPRTDPDGHPGFPDRALTPADRRETRVDGLSYPCPPANLSCVEFFGRTDFTNHLVETHELDVDAAMRGMTARGNLLCADFDTGGLVYLQDAPPSTERRDAESHDFRISERDLASCGSGIAPHEFRSPVYLSSYVHTLVLHDGTPDAAEFAVKASMRHRFPEQTERDCRIVINPWGGGQFVKKIDAPFLGCEIEATGRIGAELYQVDDGWAEGGTLTDLIVHNQANDIGFWNVSTKIPDKSFRVLRAAAQRHGTDLALWIAPSANRDYDDWKVFAKRLLEFFHRDGIAVFKLDGIQVRTKAAEDNLERLVRYVRLHSGGQVLFNFDTTNGQRPGYFLFSEYGNIFLENRYVQNSWGLGYHPESTLRNLWRLSHWIRPQKLQIEIADPGLIHREAYATRGQTPPDEYPPEYWAAIALFANPLGWFNPSALDAATQQAYRTIFRLYRSIRKRLFVGEIFPVGPEPDGGQITGFQSWNPSRRNGFLLVFRERRAPRKGSLTLKFLPNEAYRFTPVHPDGDLIRLAANASRITVVLPIAASFRLYRYALETARRG